MHPVVPMYVIVMTLSCSYYELVEEVDKEIQDGLIDELYHILTSWIPISFVEFICQNDGVAERYYHVAVSADCGSRFCLWF